MSLPFRTRVAIVSGSATGIGQQIALTLAAEGATVVVADINEKEGRRSKDQIIASGQTASFIQTDVTDEMNIQATLHKTFALYGRLDFLINNAGATPKKLIKDMNRHDWQTTLDLNLSSLFLFSKHAYPYLEKQRDAAIVNTASLHAFSTVPGLSAYAASKAGILALTRSHALEFAPNIRVNAVVPGLIETETWLRSVGDVEAARVHRLPFYPLKRLGTPEDIAHAVSFLLSDKACFITGTSIIVDGGLSSRLYREDSEIASAWSVPEPPGTATARTGRLLRFPGQSRSQIKNVRQRSAGFDRVWTPCSSRPNMASTVCTPRWCAGRRSVGRQGDIAGNFPKNW